MREYARIMSTHRSAAEMAEIVAQRGRALGMSERVVSLEVTGKPDLLRDMRRGRMPAADRLSRLATAVGMRITELLGEEGAAPAPVEQIPIASELPADVPILGTALGADLAVDDDTHQPITIEQTIIEQASVIGYMRRPPSIASMPQIYALYVVGSSMSPRFEPGEAVYVNPRRPPNIGDDVVVQIAAPAGDDGQEIISALIKRLVRRTSSHLELEQFSPPERFRINMTKVAAIHRVMPWSEVLSV